MPVRSPASSAPSARRDRGASSLRVLAVAAALTLGAGLLQPPPAVALDGGLTATPYDVLLDLAPHDATVGSVGGDASVQGGAAVYTIPIVLPPGRLGMQPELSLGYSSRSGVGIAGLGWSLGGLSSVHRCARTAEQDNETRSVLGDASDRLCLDGQRLISVASGTLQPDAAQATYGNNGAVYRSEVDSFVRVTQFGNGLGGAGSCFKVEDKSGSVRYYGGVPSGNACSNDAQVTPQGAAAPLSWMLKQERDASQNTVNYSYAAVAGSAGEVLLQEIRYTGYGSDPGNRSVTFLYEPRPLADQTSSYGAGGMTRQTRRLQAVGTHDGSADARLYLLGYAASNYSGRSHLHDVTECGYTPVTGVQVCHAPTVFAYNDSTPAQRWPHAFKRLVIPGLPAAEAQMAQPEFVAERSAAPDYVDNGVEWLPQTRPEFEGTVQQARPSRLRELGDFDGDGTRELGILHYQGNQATGYLASYSADRELRGLIDAASGLGVPDVVRQGKQLEDINGDGRSDLITTRMAGGQRRISIGIWNGSTGGWLPSGFTTYDLPISLPSASQSLGCEAVSFADMNGDGRADLLLQMPSTGQCPNASVPFPPRELRIYLGVVNAVDPALPQFAAAPAVVRALTNHVGTSGTQLEGASVMDFNGDGLPDVVLSRGADKVEQNRVLKLLFSRNAGGFYQLGGAGYEIGQMADLASPPLAADELHKEAFTTWADVNGDGLQDWISIAIVPAPGGGSHGVWAVRLNKGGLLGPRMVTSSTRGIERCINDTQVNTTNNHCGVRWKSVYPPRIADIDSDGRADLLVPRAFAARLCVREEVLSAQDPGDVDRRFWCPENPATGQLDPDPGLTSTNRDKYFGMYAPGGDAPDGSQVNRYGGDFDPSAYYLDALRFRQTDAGSMEIEQDATDIVAGQSSFDLYGDGLIDEVAYIGNAYTVTTNYPHIDSIALIGGGDPLTLPDGTPVTDLQTQRLAYVSENIGVGRYSGRSSRLPAQLEPRATGDLPRLPDLIQGATNGVGDETIWAHVPLSLNMTINGLPFYTIPTARYVDARHHYFGSSMPVVYALTRSNGIGDLFGFRTQVFQYQEAMFNHQGRGFRGFRAISSQTATGEQALQRELRTTTVYHQKFPLTGKVASVDVAPSSRPASPISRQISNWRCTVAGVERQVCPGDSGGPAQERNKIYFPYLDSQLATSYDLVQAEAGSSVEVSQIETVNASGPNASGWDDWGNLDYQAVISRDRAAGAYPNGKFVEEQRKVTSRSYTSNTATWYLDRLASETVTSSIVYAAAHALPAGASAPARSLTTTYEWNDDRTPRRQVAQAGVANEESTSIWCYRTVTADCPDAPAGISYGLPSSTAVSAPGVPLRRTRFTYSKNGIAGADDGYFVLTSTNALGHSTVTERRPRDGVVQREIAPTLVSIVSTFDAFDRVTQVEARATNNTLLEPPTVTALSRYANGACSGQLGAIAGGGEERAVYCTTTVKQGSPTTVVWNDLLGRTVKAARRGFSGDFIITKTEYDLLGTVARQSLPRFSYAGSDLWQTRSYDRQGRLARQVDPAADLAVGNGNRLTRITYAGQSAVTRVQDTLLSETAACAAGTACFETRDYTTVLGNSPYQLDAAGTATRSWVDAHGKVVAVVNNMGVLTRSSYDASGRRVQSNDPDQGEWSYSYNGLDELTAKVDARGARTSVDSRDLLGRTLSISYTPPALLPAGMLGEVLLDEWHYDPAGGKGQLDYVLRKRGPSAAAAVEVWREKYLYEATTRRLAETDTTMEGEAMWRTQFGYDGNGRETLRTYPQGLAVRSSYTDYGQLREISNQTSGALYWRAEGADSWGQVTSETFGNGIVGSHQSMDSSGQSRRLRWTLAGSVVAELTYSYDTLGNLKSQSRGGITESFSYDARQRLVGSSLSSGGSTAFGYDAAGNLLKKTDFSTSAANAYSYGAAGSGCGPHAVTSVQLNTGNSVSYTCDANGNVIGGSTLTSVFDAENRARSLLRNPSSYGGAGEEPITQPMDFSYDSKGSRYAETSGNTVTHYGPAGYEKLTQGRIRHRHELGPVVVNRTPRQLDYVVFKLRDRLGSPVVLTDGNGEALDKVQFDAFGRARKPNFVANPQGAANLLETNRGFTGHTQADAVWLVHMNGRVYDQNLGRFLSVDPQIQGSDSQSLNPYSYLRNNPLSGTDPTGYASEKLECAGTKAGGCTGPEAGKASEIAETRGATLTGSHIRGSSGHSNVQVTLVNPSAGGMAELAVAMAGSSSGYVLQAAQVEAAAGAIAADRASIGSQGQRPQDRPGRSEEGPSTGQGSGVKSAPPTSTDVSIEGKGYATPDQAAQAFGKKYGNDAKTTKSEHQSGIVSYIEKDGSTQYAFTKPFLGDPGSTIVPWGPYLGALSKTYPNAVYGYAHIHADNNRVFSLADAGFLSADRTVLYLNNQLGETRKLTAEIIKQNIRDAGIRGANQERQYARSHSGYEGSCVHDCQN